MALALSLAVIGTGFAAIVSQIVSLREFLIVFYGNEISIGIVLSVWLLWGAAGSALASRFSLKIANRVNLLTLALLTLSILIPLSVMAIRSARTIFNILPGEIMPLGIMIISSIVIVAPVCMLLGAIFSLACAVSEKMLSGAGRIGRVYALESVGSVAGGLLISFVLLRYFSSLQILYIVSVSNICIAFILNHVCGEARHKSAISAACDILILIWLAVFVFDGLDIAEELTHKSEWRSYDVVSSADSIYGNVTLVKSGEQYSFFDNGLLLYAIPDRPTSEERIHFALLEHPDPKRVLLIGGGFGGLLGEALKHPVDRIDYVEIDPLVIDTALTYLPNEISAPLRDIRVSMINKDGVGYLNGTDNKYDLIIINSGDPQTILVNRYYTADFLKVVKRALNKGGIASFAAASSESYINKELGDYLRSLFTTAQSVFEKVIVLPGDTAHFIMSDGNAETSLDYNTLMERAGERKLDIKYLREYYLFSRLSKDNIEYLDNILRAGRATTVNSYFRPVSYFYNMIFWMAQFRDIMLKKIFAAASGMLIWAVVAVASFILAARVVISAKKGRLSRAVAGSSVVVGGFSSMVLQMVIILSFQAIYGYLYYRLSLIITCFMAGLAIGSYLTSRLFCSAAALKDARAIAYISSAIALFAIMMPAVFSVLSTARLSGPSAAMDAVFFLMPVIAGSLGGALFAAASAVYAAEPERGRESGGRIYGLDLAGSCLGAAVAATLVIPVAGVFQTCFIITVLNGIIAVTYFSRKAYAERTAS